MRQKLRFKEKIAGFTERFRKKWSREKGSLVVESTLVYPVIFFVIMFLLYMGNMYYLKAQIDSVVSQEAIRYAALYADPNLDAFEEDFPTEIKAGDGITDHLYRYVNFVEVGGYGKATEAQKNALKAKLSDTGFFDKMEPSCITVKKHEVNNYIVYQTYEVEVSYDLKMPIGVLGGGEIATLKMNSREEATVTDTSEFIRTVDMAVDYAERSKSGEKFVNTINEVYGKVDGFVNGKTYDPNEAVAGGVPVDENSAAVNDNINNIPAETISEAVLGDGSQYTTNDKGQKVLKPNITYEVNGYTYKTDSQGRIISATGTIDQAKMDNPGKRNSYAQRMAGREDRVCKSNGNIPEGGVADDGGHLIASQFGGSGDLDNLVAMNSKVNRSGGEWYTMEQEWANAVKNNGSTVEVDIRPYYEGDSQRPAGFIVSYVIDGVKITPDPILNE